VTCDTDFGGVVLLVNFDGTNGQTTATDASDVGNILTFGGAAALSTANPRFGTAAYESNGVGGNQVTIPIAPGGPMDLSIGDFTCEFWLNLTAATAFGQPIMGNFTSSGGSQGWILELTNGTGGNMAIGLVVQSSGVTYTPFQIVPGVWTPVAVVRQGNQIDMFVNGVPSGAPLSAGGSIGTDTLFTISGNVVSGLSLIGQIDELRITKGVCRYPVGITYTPDSTPFSTVDCGCDPDFSDVTLLVNFDGTNGQTTATDRSLVANTLTFHGTAALSTSAPKFGTASVNGGGSSVDGVTTPVSAAGPLDLSTGDFTVEYWVKPNAYHTYGQPLVYCATNTPAVVGWFAALSAGDGTSMAIGGGLGTHAFPHNFSLVTPGVWTHIALVRQGTACDLFVDGVAAGGTPAITGSIGTDTSIQMRTGVPEYGAGFDGGIDEVRITKGLCRYPPGVAFTPPAIPFAAALCVTTPNVVGESQAAATADLLAATLIVGTITSSYSATVPLGDVISQDPVAGTQLITGDAVDLEISLGVFTPTAAPAVTGTTLADAEAAIIAAGLTVGAITQVPGPAASVGLIVSQTPAASTIVSLGTPVDLSIGTIGPIPPNFLNDEVMYGAQVSGVLNLVEFTYMPGRTPFVEGATNLIINRYKQEPGDVKQRGVDYTPFLVPGETVLNVVLSGIAAQGVDQTLTDPLVTPLVVTGIIIDPNGLKFAYTVSGGQDGIEYTVKFTTTTQIQTQDTEAIFSINVLIEDQFP